MICLWHAVEVVCYQALDQLMMLYSIEVIIDYEDDAALQNVVMSQKSIDCLGFMRQFKHRLLSTADVGLSLVLITRLVDTDVVLPTLEVYCFRSGLFRLHELEMLLALPGFSLTTPF